jgi:plastocyanin
MGHILRLNTFALQRGLRAGVLSAALVLVVGIAGAAEHRSPDARSSHTIAVIDRGLLSPEVVTIGHGDAVEFANYSSEVIEIVFIEPNDRADDVRCQRTGNPDATPGSEPAGRWPIFANGPTQHLTVTIPPGRHTTACSFAPGRYAFVTKRVARDLRSPVDGLGQKGAITVE